MNTQTNDTNNTTTGQNEQSETASPSIEESNAKRQKTNPRKRRPEMKPNVRQAVNDILHGTSVDTATEWLQREYIRLLKREASYRSESKLNNTNTQTT